ncbi:MAG: hypothetical protein NTZ51_00250, partial [Proteobacteria bacterium]|nr:hypothetical protein [Pseudomonadota bacterium]
KKMNWEVTASIAEVLFNSLFLWFKETGNQQNIDNFKRILVSEVAFEFESKNREKLLSILNNFQSN